MYFGIPEAKSDTVSGTIADTNNNAPDGLPLFNCCWGWKCRHLGETSH